MKKYWIFSLLVFLSGVSYSQMTYNFTGNGNWTKPSNWANSSIPPQVLQSGSTIYISPAFGDSCILNVTQKISRGANLIVSTGATFIILGDISSDSIPLPSNRLMKAYEIDSNLPTPIDTTKRWTFIYDNLNRLIVDSFSNTFGTSTSFFIIKFEYLGNETLSYKKIKKSYNSSSPTMITYDTTYCHFLNNKYESDSVIYDYGVGVPPGTSKTSFVYGEGFIIRNFQNWVPRWSYSATEYAKIHQIKPNGNNITYQIDTTISTQKGQPTGNQIFETSVSYLPNPNPFYKVIYPTHKEYYNTEGIGNIVNDDYSYVPEFLISRQTTSFGNLNYDYTFRLDGLPQTANVIYTAPDSTIQKTKLIFIYSQ